jgi:hypothetical protein
MLTPISSDGNLREWTYYTKSEEVFQQALNSTLS